MRRVACVDVPALPLQLLLRQRPEWAALPVAVVEEEKPQGRVLWVNRLARAAGVTPGHRYASALALSGELRARALSLTAVVEAVAELLGALRDFSPGVEPSMDEPGLFWLEADGLMGLFESLEAWAEEIRHALARMGYAASVAVGFRRGGTYAIARALQGRKVRILPTPEAEFAALEEVPLTLLGFSADVTEALARLGVERLREFLALPASGLERRFGLGPAMFHRLVSGAVELPIAAAPEAVVHEAAMVLDYRETNLERLLFALKPLVDRLLGDLAARGRALLEVRLSLDLDGQPPREEHIRTAAPTLSSATVMELIALRLSAAPFSASVLGFAVSVEGSAATFEQGDLLARPPKRDSAAAARAFARLRAAFAREDAVVKAVLRERHTPEGSFAFEALPALPPPRPVPDVPPALVRQFFKAPLPLRAAGDGWRCCGADYGPVECLDGPYRVCGGWWQKGVERLYYFAHLRRGGLLWIYHDPLLRAWFAQAEII